MQYDLSELANHLGGELIGESVAIEGATIDSRSVKPGSLFIPIVAERDGHEFAQSALAAGAAAHLSSDRTKVFGPAVLVTDTAAALVELGRLARASLSDAKVIAVTGSVGKTSVKDLTAAAIAQSYRTHKNPASFNNELGLPLTLMNAPGNTEVVVLEMGARGPGHVAYLCDIAAPDVGIVTSVAAAHTELFGSIEAVAQAKGELVEALGSTGVAVLNADDPLVAAMSDRTSARVLTFGQQNGDIRATGIELDERLRPSFTIEAPLGSRSVRLSVAGEHMATNAVAAVAAAMAIGVDLDSALTGIESASISEHRMAVEKASSGAVIIDDTYNANPKSVRAGLAALAELPASRHVAVLGVMAELGAEGASEHAAIAAEAKAAGIVVIAVDSPAYGPSAEHVSDIDGALAALGPLGPSDAVLVKGSLVAALGGLVMELM